MVLSSFTTTAQVKGAPPVFNGLNVLRNADTLVQKIKEVANSDHCLRILHLGDSHVKSGYFAEAFADSLNRFLASTQTALQVELNVMAKNGATSKHFLEEPYNAAEVQKFRPTVIIISLGTNEAQNLFAETDLQTYFSALLAQIKGDAPQSAIVFTTPGDALRKTTRLVKKRKKFYTATVLSVNNVLPTVVNFIKDFAEANGAAYWDWNAVMGGRSAMVRWWAHGYANADHIHLTSTGYNLQGWLLATAFSKLLQTKTGK